MKNVMMLLVGLLVSGTALAGGWEARGPNPMPSGGFTSAAVFVDDAGVVMDSESTGTHSTKKEARQAARDLAASNNESGKQPDNVNPDAQ